MSRGATTFRQRDVNAAIRTVERAGKEVAEVVFGPDGEIRVVLRLRDDEPEPTKKWKLV